MYAVTALRVASCSAAVGGCVGESRRCTARTTGRPLSTGRRISGALLILSQTSRSSPVGFGAVFSTTNHCGHHPGGFGCVRPRYKADGPL